MNNVFESIQKGLMEAIEFSEGNTKAASEHKLDAVDAKEELHDVNVVSTGSSHFLHSNKRLSLYPKIKKASK